MRRESYDNMKELEENHIWYFQARNNFLRNYLSRLSEPLGKVLDIGCGTGSNLKLLSEFSSAVHGIDIDAEALKLAQKTSPAVHLQTGDVNELQKYYAPQSFSLITVLSVLYHGAIRDDAQVIQSIAQLLEPGGRFFFTEPAFPWLSRQMDEICHGKRRYYKEELRAHLEKAGLEVEMISYFNLTSFFPAWLLAIKDNLTKQFVRQSAPGALPMEMRMPSPAVNAVMTTLLNAEFAMILEGVTLPLGVSLVGVARKRA